MLVAPAPVCLSIVLVEPRKGRIFAMILFSPRTVRPIFMAAPLMIVVVLFVVVGLAIFGPQRGWRNCHRDDKGRTQHGRVEKKGHLCSHPGDTATAGPLFIRILS